MLNCPTCNAVVDGLTCGKCGFSEEQKLAAPALKNHVGPLHDAATSARLRFLAKEARERYVETAPHTDRLTEQQWYNVCKFFPFVAQHCGRPRQQVGPSHPLDATSRQGPLLAGIKRRDAEADVEREAMQAEALQ